MSNVTLYSFKTGQRRIIPIEELAPGWIQINLRADSNSGLPDETVWVEESEVSTTRKVRHSHLTKIQRQQIAEIRMAFQQVRPLSQKEWEYGFKCDEHPDVEIAHWRWLAHKMKCLGGLSGSVVRGRDLLKLLLNWISTRNARSVSLTTLPLSGIPEAEARDILMSCQMTPIEFFGGRARELARKAGRDAKQAHALDFHCMGSMDEFRAIIEPADVIIGIDYVSGDVETVYGFRQLTAIAEDLELQQVLRLVYFSLHFDGLAGGVDGGTQLERFCAAVAHVKGSYSINGEEHFL
jgi:hypothetical protein